MDALQRQLVRRFVPGKTPGIVKAGMQAPGEIESANHQRSPFTAPEWLIPGRRSDKGSICFAIVLTLELFFCRVSASPPVRNGVGQIADPDRASAVGHHLLEAKAPRELQSRVCRAQDRRAVKTGHRIEGKRNLFPGAGLNAVAHSELPPKFYVPSHRC